MFTRSHQNFQFYTIVNLKRGVEATTGVSIYFLDVEEHLKSKNNRKKKEPTDGYDQAKPREFWTNFKTRWDLCISPLIIWQTSQRGYKEQFNSTVNSDMIAIIRAQLWF